MAPSVDFATRGFDPPGWGGDFYPDDLPPDWHRTFFANAFPAVLLPAEPWHAADDAWLASLAEDVPETFRVYLECPADLDPRALARAERALTHRLAGVIAPTAGPPTPPEIPRFCLSDAPADLPPGAALPAVRAPHFAPTQLREQRAWLEALAARLGPRRGLVLCDSPHLRAGDLERWWQLAYLLGLA